jgi:hypothetical protein
LPRDFYFFKLTQPLTVFVKEKGGKPDKKPYPLPYGLRNSYRNIKKIRELSILFTGTSMKLFVHESASAHIIATSPLCNKTAPKCVR